MDNSMLPSVCLICWRKPSNSFTSFVRPVVISFCFFNSASSFSTLFWSSEEREKERKEKEERRKKKEERRKEKEKKRKERKEKEKKRKERKEKEKTVSPTARFVLTTAESPCRVYASFCFLQKLMAGAKGRSLCKKTNLQ